MNACRSLVLACALVAGTASAQSLPSVRYDGYQATFPSGMRVVAYQFQGSRMASVAASYLGGRISEPSGKEGVAELTARLLLVQTGRREDTGEGAAGARPSIGQRSVAEASRHDVSVESEAILFWSRTVPGKLEAVLALEAERLRDPLAGVTADDLERARSLLVEEIERNPRARNRDEERWAVLGSVLPPSLQRPRPPTLESVRGVTWEDVVAYARTNFTADRLILAVTGPVPAKVAGRLAQAAFHDAIGQDHAAVRPAEPPAQPVLPDPAGTPMATRTGKVKKPRLWISWRVPGARSPDGRYLVMVRDVAGPLVGAAARGHGWVAFRSFDDLGSVGLVTVAVDLDAAEEAGPLLAELRELEAKPWTHERMRNALDAEIRSWFEWLRNPNASAVARLSRATGEVDGLGARRALLATPPGPDVQASFKQWLDPARAVAVLELPDGKIGGEAGAGAARTVAQGVGASPSIPPWVNRLPPGTYDVYAMAQPPGLSAAWREKLPGGLEVVALERAGFPSIEARLVVRTRTPVWDVVPRLAMQSLQPVPKLFKTDSCPMAETSVERGAITASSAGPAGTLPARLRQIACVTHLREVSDHAFGRQRDAYFRGMREFQKAGDGTLWRMLREAHRGYAPGDAWTWTGSPDEIDDIPTAAGETWVRSEMRPEHATLILVGDLPDRAAVLAEVGRAFGDWKGAEVGPEERGRKGFTPTGMQVPEVAQPGRTVLVGDAPGSKEASVVLSVPWPVPAGEDAPAQNVVLVDLQRRLERGASAGIRGVETGRDPRLGRAVIEFTCRPGEAGEAVRVALAAVETTAQAPVLAETTAFVRWIMATRFPLAFETHTEVADAMAGLVASGLPPDHWDRFPSSLSSLRPERVEAVARSLGAGKETVVVIGPGGELRKSLAAAGLRDGTPPAP